MGQETKGVVHPLGQMFAQCVSHGHGLIYVACLEDVDARKTRFGKFDSEFQAGGEKRGKLLS